MAQLKEPPKPELVDYELSQKPNSSDIQFIKARIKAYNDKASAQHHTRRQQPDTNLCVFLRDEHGQIAAGLVAKLYWNWLYIDELWVAEELRGQAHGRSMMQQGRTSGDCTRGCGCSSLYLELPGFGFL